MGTTGRVGLGGRHQGKVKVGWWASCEGLDSVVSIMGRVGLGGGHHGKVKVGWWASWEGLGWVMVPHGHVMVINPNGHVMTPIDP